MKARIQKAQVHWHGVILTTPRRTFRINFRQKPELTDGALIHTQSAVLGIAWKPNSVLPLNFRLK
jgi:hypothetical protein